MSITAPGLVWEYIRADIRRHPCVNRACDAGKLHAIRQDKVSVERYWEERVRSSIRRQKSDPVDSLLASRFWIRVSDPYDGTLLLGPLLVVDGLHDPRLGGNPLSLRDTGLKESDDDRGKTISQCRQYFRDERENDTYSLKNSASSAAYACTCFLKDLSCTSA